VLALVAAAPPIVNNITKSPAWWETLVAQLGIIVAALVAGGIALWTAHASRESDRALRERELDHDRTQRAADRAHDREQALYARRLEAVGALVTQVQQASLALFGARAVPDEERSTAYESTQREIDLLSEPLTRVIILFRPEAPIASSAIEQVSQLRAYRSAIIELHAAAHELAELEGVSARDPEAPDDAFVTDADVLNAQHAVDTAEQKSRRAHQATADSIGRFFTIVRTELGGDAPDAVE
jgi:hypothetical protein